MRGVYEMSIRITGVTTAKTLLYVTNSASKVLEILSASVTNSSNETNEQIECCIQRITSFNTPTKTDITPQPTEEGDQAAGFTAAGNVTANEHTYAANKIIGDEGAASLAGWRYQPIPEEREYVAPSASIGIRLIAAPASLDLVARLLVREIG